MVQKSSLVNARNLSLLVLVIAIGISGYLSWLKFDNVQAVCVAGGAFDCNTVLNSAYSELAGIPIAYLGLGTNFLIVALLLLEPRIPLIGQLGPVLIFGVVLFAFLFSVWLVYVQAAIIQSYCPWCLTHEALITALFGLSIWRLWNWLDRDEFEEEDLELQTQQVGD